jgi:hypothetical protein
MMDLFRMSVSFESVKDLTAKAQRRREILASPRQICDFASLRLNHTPAQYPILKTLNFNRTIPWATVQFYL